MFSTFAVAGGDWMLILWLLITLLNDGTPRDAEVLALLLKSRLAKQQDDLPLALALADEAVALDPQNRDARVTRLELRMSQRSRFDLDPEAEKRSLVTELNEEIRQFPRDYRFHKLIGMLLARDPDLARRFDLEQAHIYLDTALNLMAEQGLDDWREQSDLHYYKGQWFLKNRNYFEASRSFSQTVELNPEMTWAWFYAGQSYELANFLRSARDHYEEFKRRSRYLPNPTDASVRQTLKLIDAKLEPSPEHLTALISELQDRHAGVGQYLDAAGELFRSNRLEAAEQVLAVIPATGPRHGLYHVRRFVGLMALNRYSESLAGVERALQDASVPSIRQRLLEFALEASLLQGRDDAWRHFPSPWRALASESANGAWMLWVLETLSSGSPMDLDELESLWSSDEFVVSQIRAVRRFGAPIACRLFVAGLYWRYHHFQQAADTLANFADDGQAPKELRLTYADTLSMLGQFDRAFTIYEKILEDFPPDADVLNNFGYFMLKSERNPRRARELIEESLRLDPECRACLDSLGWAHFKLGDFERAEQLIRRALEQDRDDPEKLEHLGDVLWHLNDIEGAKRAWSQALQSMSDFAINERYLAILDKMDPPH